MNPIRLPRAAVQLAGEAEAELVQIEQKATGAVLTVAAGERVLRLAVSAGPPLAAVQPFTISATDFTRVGQAVGAAAPGPAGDLPLVVLRVSAEVAALAGPCGSPQTVTIVQTPFPDCSGLMDLVEGELASGMTRAVAAADPRHLLELGQTALAIGCTAVQFTFAPRFGLVLAEADAGVIAATVVLSGEAQPQQQPIADYDNEDPLVFTMPGNAPRRRVARPQKPREYGDGELPF
jgi:hypothetical protein